MPLNIEIKTVTIPEVTTASGSVLVSEHRAQRVFINNTQINADSKERLKHYCHVENTYEGYWEEVAFSGDMGAAGCCDIAREAAKAAGVTVEQLYKQL